MNGTTQSVLPDNNLFFLVYVSSAVKEFTKAELLELMRRSSANNAKRDITGMLLFKDGNFMQVIEGPEAAVMDVHDIISKDPRHKGLITLLKGQQKERQFPNWSMGFRNLDEPSLRDDPAYSEFMNTPFTGAEFASDPTRCRKLLLTFKQIVQA